MDARIAVARKELRETRVVYYLLHLTRCIPQFPCFSFAVFSLAWDKRRRARNTKPRKIVSQPGSPTSVKIPYLMPRGRDTEFSI